MKIIAFAGSNSKKSINRELLKHVANRIEICAVETIDLRDFDAPIYSDIIEDEGIPQPIVDLHQKLLSADGYIFASPEHNGFTPAFLKNILDWLSRIDRKTFGDKPMLFMSASPGGRAGQSVREKLMTLLPRWGANVVAQFGIGNFKPFEANFSFSEAEEQKIAEAIQKFENNFAL